MRNRMEISIGVAIGSSIQISIFVVGVCLCVIVCLPARVIGCINCCVVRGAYVWDVDLLHFRVCLRGA